MEFLFLLGSCIEWWREIRPLNNAHQWFLVPHMMADIRVEVDYLTFDVGLNLHFRMHVKYSQLDR